MFAGHACREKTEEELQAVNRTGAVLAQEHMVSLNSVGRHSHITWGEIGPVNP